MQKAEKIKKNSIIKITILILFIIGIIFSAYFNSKHQSLNYNTQISQGESPDKKHKAIKFLRSINSTTKDSYQLSIVKGIDDLNDNVGNIYISYNDFKYYWLTNKNLVIVVEDTKNTEFKKETNFKGVLITYVYE